MGYIFLADGTAISDFSRPYIIAEVNSSHNGDITTAKSMIDAAVNAHCNCVKFQSWSASSLYSQSYYKQNPIAKRFVDKFSLKSEELKILADYCHEKGIAFSSTPYSKEEVDFLVEECRVPFIKIASMEIDNPDFLLYIAKKEVPIVISTGMAEMDEVEAAVNLLKNAGNENIVLMHCVSLYPTPIEKTNLNNILGLREKFPNYPIGFSDHTLGEIASIMATTFGVAVIEKHITLDAKKIGMDNQMAMEPEDLCMMVKHCEEVVYALGTKERILSEEEIDQRKKMRRSIVTARNLQEGHLLTREDVTFKRPGTGINPQKVDKIIGKRLNKNIESDMLISMEDFDK